MGGGGNEPGCEGGVYLCVQGHIITLIQRLYWAFSSMQFVNLFFSGKCLLFYSFYESTWLRL